MKKIMTNISICLITALIFTTNSFAAIKKIEINSANKAAETTAVETEKTEVAEEETTETTKATKTTTNETTSAVAGKSTTDKIVAEETTASSQALLDSQKKVQEQQALLNAQAAQLAALQNQVDQMSKPMSTAGVWQRQDGFWVFVDFTTNQPIKSQFLSYGGNTYYLDNLGHMSTNWKFINNKWYYFGKNGEMQKGWLQMGENTWYYLDPETGVMQDTDRVIDGELFNFGKDGKWIKNVNQIEAESLADYVKSLVKYVDNKSKLKKVSPDAAFKKTITEIIDSLPKDVLTKLASSSLESIFICMNQDQENRTYMRSVGYKDEDGNREYEYLPYTTTKSNMFVNGNNPYNLYYGIGEFLAKNIKIRQQAMYNTAVWKTIHSNVSGDLDGLTSLTGTNNLIFYTGEEMSSLSCAIGWFLMAPQDLKEASDSAYKYIIQYIDVTTGGPAYEN